MYLHLTLYSGNRQIHYCLHYILGSCKVIQKYNYDVWAYKTYFKNIFQNIHCISVILTYGVVSATGTCRCLRAMT